MVIYRTAVDDDLEPCVSLWVRASADRDGRKVGGLAERARPKFDARVEWIIAEDSGGLAGFALCTAAGSELASDPQEAPVVSLLAVDSGHRGLGVGAGLLERALRSLTTLGYRQAVLHVFVDNAAAVHLYESTGWTRVGGEVMIDPRGERPSYTFGIPLG